VCRDRHTEYGSPRNPSAVFLAHKFFHTGEFAADYRRLFVELPSQTFNG
jgi:hypothetical protein